MADLKSSIHRTLKMFVDAVGFITPLSDSALDAAYDEIMVAVKRAIDTPGESPEIDTWLVRAMLDKQGQRTWTTANDATVGRIISATMSDGKRVEYADDPAIDVFCRVYLGERAMNVTANMARDLAMAAAVEASRLTPISIKVPTNGA